MKRNLLATGSCLMLMAVCLTGCDNADGDKPQTGGTIDVTVTASTGGAATRTVYQEYDAESDSHVIHWHQTDKIGVIAYSDKYDYGWFGRNIEFGLVEHDGAFGTFSGNFTDRPAEGEKPEITYHAYYPHSESNDTNNSTLWADLPAVQRPTASSFDPDADFLVSNTLKITGELGKDEAGNNINFTFVRPVAIVKLGFKLDGVSENIAGEKIEKVVFRTLPYTHGGNNADIIISGDIMASVTTQKISSAAGFNGNKKGYDNVTMDYSGQDIALDDDFNAWFTMIPVWTKGFDITIETTDYTIVKSVSLEEFIGFVENAVNRIVLDLADETNTNITEK